MAIVAGVAYGYIFQNIYIYNNPDITAANLQIFELQFRAFILLFAVILILDVLVAVSLYNYFKKHNKFVVLCDYLWLGF